ncbi:hypothetical protein TUBRATIS_000220 [Tubulinosema ratisbonensis]|uniref:Uncharacterized protein n=1 Tax=Tubulinosema ratisbonensis TaxID=291195 RepID=A0A437AQG5_9MICR|nr:hypothetical protein TUBRATIS_000220 [Tubulinosema ratisbonensis]
MNKRVKFSSQEDISQTCQEILNLPSDTNLNDSSTCSDNLFILNSSSEESVLHIKNIFIENFIQDSLFTPNKNDIKTKTTDSINKLKKEVLKNDIFSLNYQLMMETIRKEYEYHAKTPESNYED